MALATVPRAGVKRIHTYDAKAELLEMELTEPFHEKVRPLARVELGGDGNRSHYQFKHAGPFRLEGITSFQSGYTQVAGHRSTKTGHGFATLTTSVIENLNILDVLTADRVVAQISTEYPTDAAVPEVSFLGTRFDNLRIAGRKVELDTNLNILGPKPKDDDDSYFTRQAVLDEIVNQYGHISKDSELPDWATELYPQNKDNWRTTDGNGGRTLHCSLINDLHADLKTFGHVIEVPHFGKFFLGELKVKHEPAGNPTEEFDNYRFQLTMVRMKLGCPTQGNGGYVTADSNGGGTKG